MTSVLATIAKRETVKHLSLANTYLAIRDPWEADPQDCVHAVALKKPTLLTWAFTR